MTRIILLFMLLSPAPSRAGVDGPHYFITVHNSVSDPARGAEKLEESHKALLEMIKLADGQHVRLTLLFDAQYAVYMSSDPARLSELEGWKRTGHEIGAYHAGPDSGAWDGYSDLSPEELARARKEPVRAAGSPGHKEYLSALSRLEPEIKTGCMIGREDADKEFYAAAPAYETCRGPELKNEGNAERTNAGFDGINYSLTAQGGKRSLSCSHPSDRAGSAASKKAFLSMVSGVYGVSFNSATSEFGAFFAWLEFLKNDDPHGLRNRTVSGVVEGKLLPEKKAQPPAVSKEAEKREVAAQPEPEKQNIPRIKPARNLHRQEDIIMFGPPRRDSRLEKRGYCGDGICDAFERSHPGRCRRDCGK